MPKITDPVVTFYDLMSNNWDNTNTSISFDPKFSAGAYDSVSVYPSVIVCSKEEVPYESSGSRYSGLGGKQEITGKVDIDLYVQEIITDSNGNEIDLRKSSNPDPEGLVNDMLEEARRIVYANKNSMADFQWIAPGTASFIPENEPSPTVYRYNFPTYYFYQRE